MKRFFIPYLPETFSRIAVIAFTITFLLCNLLFFKHVLPWIWIIFAIIEVFGFYYFAHLFTKKWSRISIKSYRQKLFSLAFIIRLIWVIFSFFFFIYHNERPFTFEARDAVGYHLSASQLVIENFNVNSVLGFTGPSDWGFPIYLSSIYFVFGNCIIIPRVINAFIGAWSSILIYQIAKRNFGESCGRIAGIIAMLLPNFVYYAGLHLKEPLMIFLLLAFIDRADNLLHRNKITITSIIVIALLGASLFFFRTVLAMSAILALFSALILSNKLSINWLNRVLIGTWFLIVIWFFLSTKIQGEIEYLLQDQDQQEANMQFRALREGGNKLATYGSTIIFLPMIFIAPFPTFVNIELQQVQMLLSGGYFVKNILAFFVILAIILLFKRKLLRKHLLILTFIGLYLFILAKSSFALSERFHLPALPFIIILAAYGITQINPRSKKYFLPYVVFIVILIVGWNWFKLAGRGAL